MHKQKRKLLKLLFISEIVKNTQQLSNKILNIYSNFHLGAQHGRLYLCPVCHIWTIGQK